MEKQKEAVQIQPPNLKTITLHIEGTSPLVIHRFSAKAKQEMADKMQQGSVAKKGKKREAANFEDLYNQSRYISNEKWDGFNASCIRAAAISACRLCGFKMTLAKLSLFVIPDGYDASEPEFGLIRIFGKPRRLESIARVETGACYVTVRAAYDEWKASIKIRFDADQFSASDVINLLSRVGSQVGIGEGRHDSRNSVGMGWGSFQLVNEKVIAKAA